MFKSWLNEDQDVWQQAGATRQVQNTSVAGRTRDSLKELLSKLYQMYPDDQAMKSAVRDLLTAWNKLEPWVFKTPPKDIHNNETEVRQSLKHQGYLITSCFKCDHDVEFPTKLQGHPIRCPKCGAVNRLPFVSK